MLKNSGKQYPANVTLNESYVLHQWNQSVNLTLPAEIWDWGVYFSPWVMALLPEKIYLSLM